MRLLYTTIVSYLTICSCLLICRAWHINKQEQVRSQILIRLTASKIMLEKMFVCMFVCLLVCLGFFVPFEREFFTDMGSTITSEGLQILTNARHLWSLSSDCSLACHTYFDTGHPFIMFISKDMCHSHPFPNIWQWSCYYLFLRLRSVAAGIRTPYLPLAGQTL